LRVAIVANSAWYLHNFRLALARELSSCGHVPIFIGPSDGYEDKLKAAGFEFRPWRLSSAGRNPIADGSSIVTLRRLLRSERIDAVLSYTPKANIYSGLATYGLPIRFIPNVSGLGRAFIQPSPLTAIVGVLYRIAFRHARRVVFQNSDDLNRFVGSGIVPVARSVRVPGSGVDLQRFTASASAEEPQPFRFLFVGRLLRDKGVVEFVDAARRIAGDHPQVEFVLLGSSHSNNPAAISRKQLDTWLAERVIQHVEQVDDVRPQLQRSSCVVLPSYREGVPRSLLEAAAMGKPVVTTDAPGCRDTVLDGETGFLCKVRDAGALEAAMRRMLNLSPEQRLLMGRNGRRFVEENFDEQLVLRTYVQMLGEP
jgi:glycosyltransferase involved in cell wall biosynthesis